MSLPQWTQVPERFAQEALGHSVYGLASRPCIAVAIEIRPQATILAQRGDFVGRLAVRCGFGRRTQHRGFRNAISAFVGVMVMAMLALARHSLAVHPPVTDQLRRSDSVRSSRHSAVVVLPDQSAVLRSSGG